MTKMKPTTQGEGAMKEEPAKVQPPQHTHTDDIEFRAVGESEERRRFLKVAKGEETVLLDVDNINDPRSGELKILTRLGAPLIKQAARTEFLNRAHDAARAEPTFLVALKTGFYEGEFVLPRGLDPQGPANVERYFDQRYDQYHRRLHPAGTIRGWLQLADLCRDKTRLIAGLSLGVSGPVCATFGHEAPGFQLVSRGGFFKTTAGRIIGTLWGGNEKLTGKLGCGVSWNQTNLNLEIVAAAFNEMFLFLDDMHRAKKEDVEKIIEIMNGEGRGRWTETQRASFIVPVFSTSNTSGVAFARHFKMLDQLEALIDRLSDIPRPDGCPYMVEGIRTSGELREYGNKVRDLSRQNFGLAGPEFERRLTQEVKSDRASAQAFVDARQTRSASNLMRRSPWHLRPPSASSVEPELWPGIETESEAEARNEDRADALRSRVPEVARKLARCDGDSRPCQLPICAVCTRLYRIDLYLQLRELADSCRGPHMIATIYLDRFPAGQLVKANLKREHDFLRKRFDRAGLTGSTLVGGTEVAWQARHQRWLLHAHLLAIGVPKVAWDKLDDTWADSGTDDPIQPVELCDPAEQLSYLVKFHTYHKPGQSRANRRARAYPLPPDRLAELATWSSQYRFQDFLFAYGKQKRGRQIVAR